jgi:hypothetical protein
VAPANFLSEHVLDEIDDGALWSLLWHDMAAIA